MVLDTTNVERIVAEKLIYEARILKSSIDHRKLFAEQGALIGKQSTKPYLPECLTTLFQTIKI